MHTHTYQLLHYLPSENYCTQSGSPEGEVSFLSEKQVSGKIRNRDYIKMFKTEQRFSRRDISEKHNGRGCQRENQGRYELEVGTTQQC